MRARKLDVAAYRRQLAAARPKVLAWRRPDAPYTLPVAQVWQASVEAAAQDCPAARDLLELLAFLAPEPVPRDLLGADPEALPEGLRDPFDRDGAIEALARFSLLRAEPASVTVHRLVQAVTRDGLDEATAGPRRGAVRLVHAALAGHRLGSPDRWPAIGAAPAARLTAAEAAETVGVGAQEAAGRLLERRRTSTCKRAAAYAEAEPLLQRAVAIGEKALGPDHPDLATSLNNLAKLYQATGRYAEAEPLSSAPSRSARRRSGRTTPTSPHRLNNLAGLYRATGRYAEAEPLFERALAISEKALGPDHPDVATQPQQPRWALPGHRPLRRGRAAPRARPRDRREGARAGPSRHRHRLNNLAGLYRDTGRHAEAEPLYRARPRDPREGARAGPPRHRRSPQQPRRALPGHRPLRRGRAAPERASRSSRRSSPPTTRTWRRPQEPNHPPARSVTAAATPPPPTAPRCRSPLPPRRGTAGAAAIASLLRRVFGGR